MRRLRRRPSSRGFSCHCPFYRRTSGPLPAGWGGGFGSPALGLAAGPLPALEPPLGPDRRVGSGPGAVWLLAVAFLDVAGRAQGLQVVLFVGATEAPGDDVVDGEVLCGAAPGAFFGQFGAQLLFAIGFEGGAHGAEGLC